MTITADIISCVEFNHDGDLLATGDKGGRVVIFQRDPSVSVSAFSVRMALVSCVGLHCAHPVVRSSLLNFIFHL